MLSGSISNIINIIKTNVSKSSNSSYIIGIAGSSGVGKTSQIANILSKEFNCEVIHQDDFFYENRIIQANMHKADDPKSFDFTKLENIVETLKNDTKAPKITIIEGVYAFYGKLDKLIDCKIYAQAPFYSRLLKRYIRNVYERKLVSSDVVFENVLLKQSSHLKYVIKQKKQADFVLQTDFSLDYIIKKLELKPSLVLPKYEIIRDFQVDQDYKIKIFKDSLSKNYYFALVNETSSLAFDLILLDQDLAKFFLNVDFMEV